MAADCIFCRIILGEVPSDAVLQDDRVVAFRDVNPIAPTHVLVVPRRHIESVNDLAESDEDLMGHMVSVAREVARREGVFETGYRLVVNCGPDGGQAVGHLHMHVIGGRKLDDQLG